MTIRGEMKKKNILITRQNPGKGLGKKNVANGPKYQQKHEKRTSPFTRRRGESIL